MLYLFVDEIRFRIEVDVYVIQQELYNILFVIQIGMMVGYKIGCIILVMQEYFGILNLCVGGFFQLVYYGKVMFKYLDYQYLGVEVEVVVLLGKDV